jgi:hypothetical protein
MSVDSMRWTLAGESMTLDESSTMPMGYGCSANAVMIRAAL